MDLPDERLEAWEGSHAVELAEAWGVPEVHIFASVSSTNDVARELGAAGSPEGTVVIAEAQRAGRGRSGRSWVSLPGLGLWVSIVGRPAARHLQPLPVRVGVAVARALERWTGREEPKVKWPNDLLLAGRKVGGILCEASWAGSDLDHVVIGVGLNLLHAEADFPEELQSIATSVAAVSPEPVSRFAVATAVVQALRHCLVSPALDPTTSRQLARRDALFGRWIEVREPDTDRLIRSGRASGIDVEGRLIVRTETGESTITSGTVRILPGTR